MLAHNGQNAGLTVGAGEGAFILPGVEHISYVRNINRAAIIIRHNDLLHVINSIIFANSTHGDFHSVVLRLTARRVVVVGVNLIFNRLVGNAILGKLLRLQHYADSTLAGAHDSDLRYALHHLQLILDAVLDNTANLATRARSRRKGIGHNGARIQVNGLRNRLVDIVRQSTAHAGHLLTHLASLLLRVDADIELQHRFAVALEHRTRQRFDAGNLAHTVFYTLGDERFHFLRRSAAVGHTHADNRQVNVRIQIHANLRIAADAENHQQQNKHRRKDRTLDKCTNHAYLPAFSRLILLPSRSLLCPSTTIVSFSSRPLRTSATLSSE